MRSFTLAALMALASAGYVSAQNPPANPPTTKTDPTGKTCSPNSVLNYIPSGKLFTCVNGTMTAVLVSAPAISLTNATGLSGVTGLAYDAQVKATITGAVTSTVLATCPANASKFCMYSASVSAQCTDLTHLAATGTVAITFNWVDGSGSAGTNTNNAGVVLSTCAPPGTNTIRTYSVGPSQTFTYSINAGTGTYSVDYGIVVLRIQ